MQTWTLITGASEGLGAEFARIAAGESRNLILTARSEDKLNALAAQLRSDTVQVEVICADLSNLAEAEEMWQTASNNRRIDVLVNNAGLGQHGDFSDEQNWKRELSSIQVNVTAFTLLAKRAAKHMQDQGGGVILNVASLAAFLPSPHMAVYHATKSYALSLSEGIAEELSGSGVTVTALCPGATYTGFFDAADMQGMIFHKLSKPAAAQPVAQAGWDGAMKGRRIIVTGFMNKLVAFSTRLSPRRLVPFVVGKFMRKGT